MVKVKEDMTGWNMWEHGVPDSRLTVIKQTDDHITSGGQHMPQWLVECNCNEHTQFIVLGASIKCGHTKSCGCLHKEATRNRNQEFFSKTNKYTLNLKDEHGLYGIGYCSNTGNPFYFDMDDYDKIKKYCWREHTNSDTKYHSVETNAKNSKNILRIHYLIVGKYFDHIDRNPLNNRKHNLRKASSVENARNRGVQSNNLSGYTGVYFDKNKKKWTAHICINKGVSKFLGYFDNKDDAVRTRLEAEAKYFGEFAPQRHLFEQYKINVDGGDSDD